LLDGAIKLPGLPGARYQTADRVWSTLELRAGDSQE
jgi:hypothetical protein